MSFKVIGMEETFAKLEAKFSEGRVARYENQALNDAAQTVAEDLKQAVKSYSYPNSKTGAKGYTAEEVTAGKSRMRSGERTVSIGFSGPHERYRLVHLNEFGYTRFHKTYHPKGMGKMQGVYDADRQKVYEKMKEDLKKLL
ncbi:hypothetical protein [Lacticaseibacillus rhamnosus]|uniref:hypothetical protein n=1 Tax=Lacticaseibacillus rhamnosus TaxID=47715 RepID=UPI00237F7EB0|nr:hypothetical protein [Lacticaseibacillus rhamnosus]MDE3295908.1 hypothetical protein [Lacticaseibacillus rhamnosus]